MNKSSTGLSENIASFIAYLGAFVTGIIFLIVEKENKVVRFHALQSTVLFGALGIITWLTGGVFGWIPLIGGMADWILRTISFIAWVYLCYTAFAGKLIKVPFIGEAAWNYVNK